MADKNTSKKELRKTIKNLQATIEQLDAYIEELVEEKEGYRRLYHEKQRTNFRLYKENHQLSNQIEEFILTNQATVDYLEDFVQD